MQRTIQDHSVAALYRFAADEVAPGTWTTTDGLLGCKELPNSLQTAFEAPE